MRQHIEILFVCLSLAIASAACSGANRSVIPNSEVKEYSNTIVKYPQMLEQMGVTHEGLQEDGSFVRCSYNTQGWRTDAYMNMLLIQTSEEMAREVCDIELEGKCTHYAMYEIEPKEFVRQGVGEWACIHLRQKQFCYK